MPKPTAGLAFVYSGGPGNTNPLLSIGGQVSTAAGRLVQSQSATGAGVSGVTIQYASRNLPGVGLLEYNQPTATLSWTPSGGEIDSVAVAAGGLFTIGVSHLAGYLVVEVDELALPGANVSSPMTIAHLENTVFTVPASNELASGVTEYVCLYLVNRSEGQLVDVTVTLAQDTPVSEVSIGSDRAPLSSYRTPPATRDNFLFGNPFTATAMLQRSAPASPRESLDLLNPGGGPLFLYYGDTEQQDSNGVDEDLPVLLESRYASGGQLALVSWGSSLTWDLIPAGRMVSFFLRRTVPAGTESSASELINLDISLTSG